MSVVEISATAFSPGWGGGGERHFTSFVEALGDYEEVHVSTVPPPGVSADPTIDIPLSGSFITAPPFLSKTNPLPKFASAAAIRRYLRAHNREIEFLHVHNLRTSISALWLFLARLDLPRNKCRVILTDHNAKFVPFPSVLAGMVDYYAPVSVASNRQLQAWGERPARVIPTAASKFFAGQPPPPEFQSRERDLLFVGRLVPWKRPDRLIDLVSLIREKTRRIITATIAGSVHDPSYLEHIQRRIRQADHEREIRLVVAPTDDDLLRLYRSSKLLVALSETPKGRGHQGLSELAPISILEAGSSGTPPVINDIPEMADQVQNGVTGLVVNERDNEAAASAIASVLSNPDLWSRLSQNVRSQVLRERTYPVIARRFHQFLEDIRNGVL